MHNPPPFLNLPQEEYKLYSGVEIYTAVVNSIRVFVFSSDKLTKQNVWLVELDEQLGPSPGDSWETYFMFQRFQHETPLGDPLTLLAVIMQLTSGGNLAGSESDEGARPDAGRSALDDSARRARFDDREQGRREVAGQVAD